MHGSPHYFNQLDSQWHEQCHRMRMIYKMTPTWLSVTKPALIFAGTGTEDGDILASTAEFATQPNAPATIARICKHSPESSWISAAEGSQAMTGFITQVENAVHWRQHTSGSSRLSRLQSSCSSFCNGVPVSRRRRDVVNLSRSCASLLWRSFMRCASSMMTYFHSICTVRLTECL